MDLSVNNNHIVTNGEASCSAKKKCGQMGNLLIHNVLRNLMFYKSQCTHNMQSVTKINREGTGVFSFSCFFFSFLANTPLSPHAIPSQPFFNSTLTTPYHLLAFPLSLST